MCTNTESGHCYFSVHGVVVQGENHDVFAHAYAQMRSQSASELETNREHPNLRRDLRDIRLELTRKRQTDRDRILRNRLALPFRGGSLVARQVRSRKRAFLRSRSRRHFIVLVHRWFIRLPCSPRLEDRHDLVFERHSSLTISSFRRSRDVLVRNQDREWESVRPFYRKLPHSAGLG